MTCKLRLALRGAPLQMCAHQAGWYVCRPGPSRALYLPRGLLDPQDIPSYLNGSLAGE